MKKLAVILIFNLFSLIAVCQDTTEFKTLFGNVKTTGFYYGINCKSDFISQRYVLDFGVNGALILNDNFTLGMQGNAFWQKPEYDIILKSKFNLQGYYGGLFFEPVFLPNQAVHFTIPIYFGAGIVGYCEVGDDILNSSQYYTYAEMPFVFAEPGVEIEFNLVKTVRFSFGAHYKYTSNIDLTYDDNTIIFPSTILNNFNLGFTLKFGSFVKN